MAEKSLWHTVGTCKEINGSALLNMLKPTPSGNILLPKGSIKKLNLELEEQDMHSMFATEPEFRIKLTRDQ